MKYTSQHCCDKTMDGKWPYIANALFRIAQIHGRQSYLRRLQEGDRPNYPSVSAHAPGTLKPRLFALQFMQTTACDLVPDVRLICCVMLTQAERDVKTWSEWNKPILKLSQHSLTAMQTNVFIEYITKEQKLRVPIKSDSWWKLRAFSVWRDYILVTSQSQN